jgi:hypothetical protein
VYDPTTAPISVGAGAAHPTAIIKTIATLLKNKAFFILGLLTSSTKEGSLSKEHVLCLCTLSIVVSNHIIH